MSDYTVKKKDVTFILNLNLICATYIISWILLPAFSIVTNGTIFRIIFTLITGVWISTSVLYYHKLLGKCIKIIFAFLIFSLIFYLNFILGRGDFSSTTFINYILVFIFTLQGVFYISINNPRVNNYLLKLMCILFFITTTTTLYNLLINPNAARLLTASSTAETISSELSKKNIGAYDYIYGVVISLPALLVCIKDKYHNKVRFRLMILTIVSIICVLKANFTIAYILIIITFILITIPIEGSTLKKMIMLIILSIATLIIAKPIIIYILTLLKDLSNSILQISKLEGLIGWLEGTKTLGETSSRIELFKVSLNTFINNPLCGVGGFYQTNVINSIEIGKHSQFIDDLARFGVLGGGALIYQIIVFTKVICKHIRRKKIRIAFLYSTFLFLICCNLNPSYSYGILLSVFLFVPILCKYFDDSGEVTR